MARGLGLFKHGQHSNNIDMIEEYSFGHIQIDGKAYEGDIKIINGMPVPNWWQEVRHKIQPQDLTDIPDDCEFIVIGNGASSCNEVTSETIQMLEKRGLPFKIEATADAVKTFNKLAAEGKKIMGAFHLTC